MNTIDCSVSSNTGYIFLKQYLANPPFASQMWFARQSATAIPCTTNLILCSHTGGGVCTSAYSLCDLSADPLICYNTTVLYLSLSFKKWIQGGIRWRSLETSSNVFSLFFNETKGDSSLTFEERLIFICCSVCVSLLIYAKINKS